MGLNPQVLPSAILTERIINNYDLYQNREKVSHVHFYGAGCGVESPARRIEKVFTEIFTQSNFSILEDTYAAVYVATQPNDPAIVCIMGTGSNCTYFDGKEIEQRITSLGYVLMDEASGNFLENNSFVPITLRPCRKLWLKSLRINTTYPQIP